MKQKEEQKTNKKENKATEQIYLRMTSREKKWLTSFYELVRQERIEVGLPVPTLNKIIRALILESLITDTRLLEVME